MLKSTPTYRNFFLIVTLFVAMLPGISRGQGNLPCPPVDVNRADVINSLSATVPSFSFTSISQFQNGLSSLINLYVNAKGGKNYEIRYRFLNGALPTLSASGQTMDVTNAFKADASFGASGWGTLNIQVANKNQTLSTGWSVLGTFKARCAVTNGNFIVNLKALGTNAGVTSFFKKGATPPLDYGAVTVEFQLWRTDDNTLQDTKTIAFNILVGDVLDFAIGTATTTIDATPWDYINGLDVTMANQLTVTSNNAYDISVSSSSSTLDANGNGAVGAVPFNDISLRIASTTLNMGTLATRNLTTTNQSISTGATGSAMAKPIGLTYHLQNPNPKNLTPGTYSGTIYISVTEN
jgi:hypothetical protein